MGRPKIAGLDAVENRTSVGADMTRAGLDVTFIDQWPAPVEAMRKDGIRIEMPDESRHRKRGQALTHYRMGYVSEDRK
jgi:2-dehydropantoate 2-reductase